VLLYSRMNTAHNTQTPRIFSRPPHIAIALPGWVSSIDYFVLTGFGSINLDSSLFSFPQSMRESLARVLSFYRTSSVVISPSSAVGDPEKGGVVSDFRISYKSVALSPGSRDGKTGRTSQHVIIAPSPVKEGRRVQRIGKTASCWLRFRLWFNTYRYVPSRCPQ
jgi:hypothetical protein